MSHDVFPLNIVQDQPHLLRRVLLVIEIGNEFRDRALEVDVVFPQRVIGVDEQRLRTILISNCHLFPELILERRKRTQKQSPAFCRAVGRQFRLA